VNSMRWTSQISTSERLHDALEEVADAVCDELGGEQPQLVLVFVSGHHRADYAELPDMVRARFPDAVLLGCSGGGIIGAAREVEGSPALSLSAAVLPDVAMVPFHLDQQTIEELGGDSEAWQRYFELVPEQQPAFVLLPDPFSCDTAALGHYLDQAYPSATKVGGLASGGEDPGEMALFLEDGVHAEGVVGLALYGDIVLDAVVAQGCRPVGVSLTITRAERNLIYELDGLPAVSMLEAVLKSIDEADRQRFRRSPMIGLVTDPDRKGGRTGDYLIRNLIGLDRRRGLIGIGAIVENGQKVRFHVRDADASAEDLRELLGRYRRSMPEPPAGALLFSCLGRGEGLYGVPDHDSAEVVRQIGELPLGGFFGNGEIGPVHGRTFLHGYTSSLGFFRPRPWS